MEYEAVRVFICLFFFSSPRLRLQMNVSTIQTIVSVKKKVRQFLSLFSLRRYYTFNNINKFVLLFLVLNE